MPRSQSASPAKSSCENLTNTQNGAYAGDPGDPGEPDSTKKNKKKQKKQKKQKNKKNPNPFYSTYIANELAEKGSPKNVRGTTDTGTVDMTEGTAVCVVRTVVCTRFALPSGLVISKEVSLVGVNGFKV